MQLVILGYHRSGTSAVSQNCNAAGLFVGFEMLEANATNPMGHFEDVQILDLHVDILSYNGEHWLAPSPFTPIYTRKFFNQARHIASERDLEFAVWGFKEPRTCLFLDLWELVLNDPRYIVCLRHYESCIYSLQRRSLKDIKDIKERKCALIQGSKIADPTELCLSWINYMDNILRLLSRSPEKCLVFRVDKAEGDQSLAKNINDRFGTNLDPIKIEETFQPALFNKQSRIGVEIDEGVKAQADKVWNKLCEFEHHLI